MNKTKKKSQVIDSLKECKDAHLELRKGQINLDPELYTATAGEVKEETETSTKPDYGSTSTQTATDQQPRKKSRWLKPLYVSTLLLAGAILGYTVKCNEAYVGTQVKHAFAQTFAFGNRLENAGKKAVEELEGRASEQGYALASEKSKQYSPMLQDITCKLSGLEQAMPKEDFDSFCKDLAGLINKYVGTIGDKKTAADAADTVVKDNSKEYGGGN